jgi:UDP-glucose 4-epimerase
VVIARLFNTVGPRQTGRYGMVVPRFVSQALKGEPITIYGTGEQTRCFCHVKDVVGALIQLMQRRECVGQVFNIGNDHELSMNALAAKILELTGSGSPLTHIPYDEAYGPGFEDMLRRRPNVAKLRTLLGQWAPRSLEAILNDVIAEKRGLD